MQPKIDRLLGKGRRRTDGAVYLRACGLFRVLGGLSAGAGGRFRKRERGAGADGAGENYFAALRQTFRRTAAGRL